jgi:transcriptional regulator with XRE-family HTH domain
MALRNQEIGARLRELRGQRPQTVVADELGVAERTYQNWEAGDAKPSYRNLQKIAAYHGVGEDYILTGERSAVAGGGDASVRITPSPYSPVAIEGELAGVLAEIKAQLAEQTRVLEEIKGHATRVEAMLEEQREIKEETDEVAETIRTLGRAIVEGRPIEDVRSDQQAPARSSSGRKSRAAASRTPSRP